MNIRRIYDLPGADDGARILVDRLWPRGLSRDKAVVDLWLKDIAPSDDLRKRFHARPADWELFRAAHADELTEPAARAAVGTLGERLRQGPVTLLFAARDANRNNAVALKVALKALLEHHAGGRRAVQPSS